MGQNFEHFSPVRVIVFGTARILLQPQDAQLFEISQMLQLTEIGQLVLAQIQFLKLLAILQRLHVLHSVHAAAKNINNIPILENSFQ